MTSELMSLTAVTVLTAVLWMPYILNTMAVRGIVDAVGYPEDPKPLSAWASKMRFETEKLMEIARRSGAKVESCRVSVSRHSS